MSFLTRSRHLMAELFPEWHKSVIPCDERSIKNIESMLGVRLPKSFLELLLWLGEKHFALWPQELSDCDTLIAKNQAAREWLTTLSEEFGRRFELPENSVVIHWDGGGHFKFQIASDSDDDPPVYWFVEPVMLDFLQDEARNGDKEYQCLIDNSCFDGVFAKQFDNLDNMVAKELLELSKRRERLKDKSEFDSWQ